MADTRQAVAELKQDEMANQTSIRFDRSRAQLRIPASFVPESLRFAHSLHYALNRAEKIQASDSKLVHELRSAGVIVNDDLDPIAAGLLNVANQASLIIKVQLAYGSESSSSTIWATPRRAIVSAPLDPDVADFRPVDVFQLPYILSDLMVARSPKFVGEAPISVSTKAVARAEEQLGDQSEALSTLVEAGLSNEQAERVLRFQAANVRRWRVSSTWSTEHGQDSSELRGLDADAHGQWLVAMTGSRDEKGQITFTPLGHGDLMRALRSVLPRSWIGTPLNKQPTD